MTIKFVADVGAPLTVTAVNLVAESVWPQRTDWITYAMTALGYGAAFFNRGGDFAKNIGVSSMPLTARLVYDAVKGTGTPVSRSSTVRKRVARYPGSAQEAPFQGVKLT